MAKNVVVIGAGASGLMAAESAASAGARVILLEKMDIPGAKMRLTGNRRCNLANTCDPADFASHVVPRGRFVRGALERFPVEDLRFFLEERGVPTYVDAEGKVFPRSNEALDVVQCLVKACERIGVEIRYCSAVDDIVVEGGQVTGVRLRSGETLPADAIVLCTGGATYPHTGSSGDGYSWAHRLGHTVFDPKPGLVGMRCSDPWLASLQGISVSDVAVTLYADERKLGSHHGSLLFAHDGLSGPAILSLSLFVARELRPEQSLLLQLDLTPNLNEQELDSALLRLAKEKRIQIVMDLLREFVPAGLAAVILYKCEIDEHLAVAQLTTAARSRLVKQLKRMSVQIDGTRPLERGMVTVGGVSTRELNPRTMESNIVRGLYMAGEVIDIAGDSGGYNLQMAFCTGRLAGENAAREEQT